MPRPIQNPPNPWQSEHVEWLEEAPPSALEVFEERARSILATNDSPDIPFRFSVNPYRGCFHACAYCYARPSHQQLGFGAGTDFDRRIVVKCNAPELLRDAFERSSWGGDLVVFSGVTDCYQPLEASYRLTRRCLEVCADYCNPVGIVTKGILIRRDVDVLRRLVRDASVHVYLSIAFADDATSKAIEPFASTPTRRFETLQILADAGVHTGVLVAPVIPGLNDEAIPEILMRAKAAGAQTVGMTPIRLPAEVLPVFEQRLREAVPLRASRVMHAIHELRGGKPNEPRFGRRMHGEGPRWQAICALFDAHRRRLGFAAHAEVSTTSTFRRPTSQGSLF